MADRLSIASGASADIRITVTDPSNDNAPLDMSAALGILILLYDVKNKIWARFTTAAGFTSPPYYLMDSSEKAAGILTIKVREEQTIKSAIGKIYMDVKVTFTDEDGSNNDANLIAARIDIGDLVDNQVKALPTH